MNGHKPTPLSPWKTEWLKKKYGISNLRSQKHLFRNSASCNYDLSWIVDKSFLVLKER